MKTLLTKAWLLALLLAVVSLLAACGSTGGGHQGSDSAGAGEQGTAEKSGGMDHSNMDHGSMGMGPGGMARQMVMENGKYSDKTFIDAMVPHHQSAIEMAQVALEQTENPEIKELAGNIVSAQHREIEQMRQWRQAWYPEG